MTEISCIICVYNEGERIKAILSAVYGHPGLSEIIVVNDGSTDETEAVLAAYPDIKLITYSPNRGKTYAMARGIAAARGEYLMFLDADLSGVEPRHIDALAEPVRRGKAEATISLRSNSLALYRALGLDFVSGERVVPTWLLADAPEIMESLPRWGAEAFINERIIAARMRLAVVDWPTVVNVRKHTKIGLVRGALAELKMIGDAVGLLTPLGLVRQNYCLLRQAGRLRWLGKRRRFAGARAAP